LYVILFIELGASGGRHSNGKTTDFLKNRFAEKIYLFAA